MSRLHVIVATLGLMTALASKPADLANKHAYGHLLLHGAVNPIEAFRATFGGLFPCGRYEIYLGNNHNNTDGCKAIESGDVEGKYVVVHRGNCPVYEKALNAQKARAVGLLVINNEAGLQRVGTGNITLPTQILLPVAMIPKVAWEVLRIGVQLEARLTASLHPTRDICTNITQTSLSWNETVRHPVALVSDSYVQVNASNVAVSINGFEIEEECSAHYNITFNGTFYDSTAAPSNKEILMHALHSGGRQEPEMPENGLIETAKLRLEMPIASQRQFTDEEITHIQSLVNDPQAEAIAATFSGPAWNASVEILFDETSIYGCENSTEYSKNYTLKYVLVLRGHCPMINKTRIAQLRGAAGVIIVNEGFSMDAIGLLNSGFPQTAATLQQRAAVQAIADDHLKTQPVHIPTVMVSAHAARKWFWRNANGELRSITGLFARFMPTRARGDAWHTLTQLESQHSKLIPSDEYHKLQYLANLVRANSPYFPGGDAERMNALHNIAEGLNLSAALEKAHQQVTGHAQEGTAPADPSPVPLPFTSGFVWSSFLTQYMPSRNLERITHNPNIVCSQDAGKLFIFHLDAVDLTSSMSVSRRVQELLRQQACIEQLLLHNAVALGSYLSLLRQETSPEEWTLTLMSLLHPFHWPRDAAHNFTEHVVALVKHFDNLHTHPGNVKSFVDSN